MHWVWALLARLCPEPSLYDSCLLLDDTEAMWAFLCLTLVGLFFALFVKKPNK
jgi:hypothetical protein